MTDGWYVCEGEEKEEEQKEEEVGGRKEKEPVGMAALGAEPAWHFHFRPEC